MPVSGLWIKRVAESMHSTRTTQHHFETFVSHISRYLIVSNRCYWKVERIDTKKKKKGLSVFNSNFQLFITLLLSGIKKIYLNRHCMSEDKLVFSP